MLTILTVVIVSQCHIYQNIRLYTLNTQLIVCHLCLIEGDTSELCELGALLTFPSIIFLITEGTMNHAEDGVRCVAAHNLRRHEQGRGEGCTLPLEAFKP